MPTIRIMLVDDHGLMRQGLRAILQQEEGMVVIGEASSGEALLQQIENGACPDVVLMDAYLGGMSGVEATEQLKRIRPAACHWPSGQRSCDRCDGAGGRL